MGSRILKNYASSLTLLAGVLVGGVCGVVFGDGVRVVKPIGDLFLNLVFTMVVPLVFFSIASSICKMKGSGMLGRFFVNVLLVFLGMSVIASVVAYLGTLVFNPLAPGGNVGAEQRDTILAVVGGVTDTGRRSIGDLIVSSLSVPDFTMLFSKDHLLPLIVFSGLLGFGVCAVGEKAEPIARFFDAGTDVTVKVLNVVMRLAPLGLGCYFAYTISVFGSQILSGYARTFVMYAVLAAIFFFGVNSLYIWLARGTNGLKAYWAAILPPSLTAMATCSSAVAIPGNIEAAKAIGVRPTVAESVIPLGTNIHKDGSVAGGVVKTVFLMTLLGQSITTPGGMLTVLGVGFISAVVVGAVTGGGATGEILICSLLGVPVEMAAIIIVIGTIVDMPATLMNSSSNVVASVLVDRFTSGRKKSPDNTLI